MKLAERLRKPDWLAELQAVVTAVLAVAAVLVVIQIVSAAIGGVVARVPADAVTGVDGAGGGLRAGAVVRGDVDVLIEQPSAAQLATYNLTNLPTLVVLVAVLILLRQTLRRGRQGDPFDATTVGQLRVTGGVALVGGLLAQVVQTVAAMELSRQVLDGNAISATVDLAAFALWFLAGFAFFVVGEFVRRGAALRTELETVI